MDPESEKVPAEKLSRRFALGTKNLLVIVVTVLLIGGWAVVRGKRASGCRLGRPLRVGIIPWAGFAGGLVANNGLRPNKDSDFWRSDNLLVEFVLVEKEDELLQEFKRGGENGGLDVIWSTVDSLVYQSPLLAEVDPRAFMQVDWSVGGDAIVADSRITRVEELKDQRIASAMASSQWLLEFSLKNSSLKREEQDAIIHARHKTGDSAEARKEFEDGKVQAAVLREPDISEARQRRMGSQILIGTETFDGLIADVMVAKEDFIHDHRDVIAAFIRGWLLQGTPKARRDPMIATKALQQEPVFAKLGEAKTRELLEKVTLATLNDNAAMFGLSNPQDARFDSLFNEVKSLWFKNGHILNDETQPGKVRDIDLQPAKAHDIDLLKEIYSSLSYEAGTLPRTGCNSIVMTRGLTITFQAGSHTLEKEALAVLDGDEVSSMIRPASGARFSIQVILDKGNEVQEATDIAKERADAVIDYLALHYDRPRSKFAFAGSRLNNSANSGESPHNIFLSLVSPPHAGEQTNADLSQNGR